MTQAEIIKVTLEWNERGLEKTLKVLSFDDLHTRPNENSNPIGWLIWHGTRVEDRTIADLSGNPQIWISNEWYLKFKRERDPLDRGFGHTAAQVSAFMCPSSDALAKYHDEVRIKTFTFLDSLSDQELSREVETDHGPNTVAQRLANLLNEMIIHGGQAAYVRGLLQGPNWSNI